MAESDIIMMKRRDLKRLYVVKEVLCKKLGWKKAAEILELSIRQIGRLVAKVKTFGDVGIVHKLRGVISNRRYDVRCKEKVIDLYKKKYEDFGPTLASEKLIEMDGISLSKETLRGWLIDDKSIECSWRRKGRKHRQWRERKAHRGEMVQMDGSVHDWFECRGPRCVLMGYIDDASNEVYARFYDYEGTFPAMESFRRYIRKYGIPHSLYADRHTTYRSTAKLSIEEELAGKMKSQTQFERAVGELGVKIIPAYSPQAKGRIERQFRTFQDRLVKEMRLRKISSMEEANEFLEQYLLIYNKRFGVVPKEKADLHRPVPQGINLDRIFCLKEKHAVRNDFTVVHDRKLYQLKEHTKAKSVIVEEQSNGRIRIYSNDSKKQNLGYKEITELPKKKSILIKKPSQVLKAPMKKYIPPADHPWRRPFKFNWRLNALKREGIKPLAA